MDKKRRRGVLALMLVLSIGNYLRLDVQHEIRWVLFLSIFVMGALAGILLSDLAHLLRSKRSDKDKVI